VGASSDLTDTCSTLAGSRSCGLKRKLSTRYSTADMEKVSSTGASVEYKKYNKINRKK